MNVTPFEGLPGPLLVTPVKHADERGWFRELHKQSALARHGIGPFVQENESNSSRGVIRGLHLQADPHAQGKLVRCSRGSIFDVAVDVRPSSPTYRALVGVRLDDAAGQLLWIPAGFAHGFQALADAATVSYLVTREYHAPAERTIRWNDPTLSIPWPLPAGPMNARDKNAPILAEANL